MRRRDSSWGADLAANGNRIPSIWSRPRLLMMMSASRRSCRVATAVGDDGDGESAVRGATAVTSSVSAVVSKSAVARSGTGAGL